MVKWLNRPNNLDQTRIRGKMHLIAPLALIQVVIGIFVSGCGLSNDSPANRPVALTPESVKPSLFHAGGAECSQFIRNIPAHFKLLHIKVPENWDDPNGPKTSVFVYYRPALIQSPAQELPPVIVMNGGPAFNSHSYFEMLETTEHFKKRFVVYLDQRGTGCSQIPPYQELTQSSTLSDAYVQRLSYFGSRSIVQDSEAIRKTLFGENVKWSVFGSSYGSLIAHRYLEIAPEGVHSVYAHGYALMNDPLDHQMKSYFGQKRISNWYFNLFPAAKPFFERAHHLEQHHQVKLKNDETIQGLIFKVWKRMSDSIEIPFFKKFVKKLLTPTGDLNLDFINSLIPDDELSPPSRVQAQVQAQERVFRNVQYQEPFYETVYRVLNRVLGQIELNQGLRKVDLCRSMMSFIEQNHIHYDPWIYNDCEEVLQMEKKYPDLLLASNKLKPDPIEMSTIQKNLALFPQIKVYLYSGDLDLISPPETFQEELSLLGSQVTHKNLMNSGHAGFLYEPLFIRDFLAQ